MPGQDFTQEVGFKLTSDNWMLPGACGAPEPELEQPSAFASTSEPSSTFPSDITPSSSLFTVAPEVTTSTTPVPDDQHSSDDEQRDVTVKLQDLSTSDPAASSDDTTTYFGKSSARSLLSRAFELRAQLAPGVEGDTKRRSTIWKRPFVRFQCPDAWPTY